MSVVDIFRMRDDLARSAKNPELYAVLNKQLKSAVLAELPADLAQSVPDSQLLTLGLGALGDHYELGVNYSWLIRGGKDKENEAFETELRCLIHGMICDALNGGAGRTNDPALERFYNERMGTLKRAVT